MENFKKSFLHGMYLVGQVLKFANPDVLWARFLPKCLAFFILVEFFCKFHQSPIILCLICWQFSQIYFLPPQEHIVHFYFMLIFQPSYNLLLQSTNINFGQLNMFFKKCILLCKIGKWTFLLQPKIIKVQGLKSLEN